MIHAAHGAHHVLANIMAGELLVFVVAITTYALRRK